MSKLLEYLRLLPEGFKNAGSILQAVVNQVQLEWGGLPPEMVEEIIRRRLICKACPHMSENAKKNPAVNYKSDRTDEHCTFCKCPITTRTAALDKACGITAHNQKHPHNPLPLKWEVYKPKPSDDQTH